MGIPLIVLHYQWRMGSRKASPKGMSVEGSVGAKEVEFATKRGTSEHVSFRRPQVIPCGQDKARLGAKLKATQCSCRGVETFSCRWWNDILKCKKSSNVTSFG